MSVHFKQALSGFKRLMESKECKLVAAELDTKNFVRAMTSDGKSMLKSDERKQAKEFFQKLSESDKDLIIAYAEANKAGSIAKGIGS